MATVVVEETVNAPRAAVFKILGNFSSIKAGPGIDKVDYEGEGVGMRRHIHTPGGCITERLTEHAEAEGVFAYVIENDDSPLPFTGYSARVVMSEGEDGTTIVNWSGTFEPRGVEEAKAKAIASGIYQRGIEGAKKALA